MDARPAPSLQDGRFLLLETLGRGAMGSVYRAFDRTTQRLVALKVPHVVALPGPSHPLSAEFAAWSRLEHPNIARAYEMRLARSGPIARDTPYLVLEHVAGGPVHRLLRPGRLAHGVIVSVARQLLCALEHVHRQNLVHRDLKPGNVLVENVRLPSPRVRLIDFGLAVRRGASRNAGTFSGSLPFVAPEALLGFPLDGRTDLYGLGVMLYLLATGEMPVPGGDVEAVVRWHLAGPPADPTGVRPRLPRHFCRLVRRLTARPSEDRPSSAREALAMLGVHEDPPVDRHGLPASAGGERDHVLLNLDAVRLGAARVLVLPPDGGAALRDASVRAQILGLPVHVLRGCVRSLTHVVLALLLDRPNDIGNDFARYGLHQGLPLRLVGGQPLLDPAFAPRREGSPAAARRIAEFVRVCARRAARVLCVVSGPAPEPFVGAVVDALKSAMAGDSGPSRGSGGLLLLVHDAGEEPRGDLSSRSPQRAGAGTAPARLKLTAS